MTDQRGRLTIYFGYAAGVGKTYQMLDDARRMKSGGKDVVIGFLTPHGSEDTLRESEGIERIPLLPSAFRGSTAEEMDVNAILARKPEMCVVDELAHTNALGSARSKRW